MQKIFFTSDTHFGHKGGLDVFSRDFQSIDEHDGYLIDKINSVVEGSSAARIANGNSSANFTNVYLQKKLTERQFISKLNWKPEL